LTPPPASTTVTRPPSQVRVFASVPSTSFLLLPVPLCLLLTKLLAVPREIPLRLVIVLIFSPSRLGTGSPRDLRRLDNPPPLPLSRQTNTFLFPPDVPPFQIRLDTTAGFPFPSSGGCVPFPPLVNRSEV